MFPAQKKDAAKATASKNAPDTGQMGFGKVLTSIQGLQQRLEDFSLEDVARTEANAQTLALKLSQLQADLNGIHELQGFVTSVNARLDAIPEENFDHVEPASLEKYPALAAILQAVALMRRPGLTRPEKPVPAANDSKPDAIAATVPVEVLAQQIFVSEEPDRSNAGAAISTKRIDTEDWVLSADNEKDFILSPHSGDFELGSLPGGDPPQATPQSSAAPASEKTSAEKPQSAASPDKTSTSFDERLLNELIESYGEFTISSGAAPSAKPAAAEPPVVESKVRPSLAEPAVIVETKPVEKPASPNTAPIKTHSSPKPAPIETSAPKATIQLHSAPMETLPAVLVETEEVESKALIVAETPKAKKEQREARAKEKKLQVASKRGEIDRQLKSIIKDYGEVDLYSPRSTINFKLAAVGAFVVLGLVLGGLYFFKASSTPTPAVVNTVEQTDGAKSIPPTHKPAEK
jgi:hypothetical protein